MKPIEGAGTGGAAGFFKGVGKGLVGFVITLQHPAVTISHNPFSSSAVTKPVVGVFDLASNVSEGMQLL
jgi:vacuolar protein sorting-associated protein 13A/C